MMELDKKNKHYIILAIILILYLIPSSLLLTNKMEGSVSINAKMPYYQPTATIPVTINYIIKNQNKDSVSLLFWSDRQITVDIVRVLSNTEKGNLDLKTILNPNITINQKGIDLISSTTTRDGIAEQMTIYFYSLRSQLITNFNNTAYHTIYPASSSYSQIVIHRLKLNILFHEYLIVFLIALGMAGLEFIIIRSQIIKKGKLKLEVNKNLNFHEEQNLMQKKEQKLMQKKSSENIKQIDAERPMALTILGFFAAILIIVTILIGFTIVGWLLPIIGLFIIFIVVIDKITSTLAEKPNMNVLYYNLFFTLFMIISIYYGNQFFQYFLISSIFNLIGYLLIVGLINLILIVDSNLRGYIFIIYSFLKFIFCYYTIMIISLITRYIIH